MQKVGKIIAGIAVLVGIVVIGGFVVLSSMDLNEYKGLIAEEAKKATGRELVISGNLDLQVSFSPSIVVDGVSFANADWGSRKEMVTVRRFEAQVQLLPLLSGNIEIDRVILIEPDVLIETDKNGKGNWEFAASAQAKPEEKTEPGSGGGAAIPAIHEVRVEKLRFTYVDGVAGKTTQLALDSLSGQADGLNSPLKLALAGSFNGKAFSADATLGSAAQMMGGGSLPIDLVAKAGGATVTVKGAVAKPAEGKGIDLALSVNGENIADLAALADAPLHKMGPYSVAAKVSDPDGGYALSGLKVKVGTTDLGGDVKVSLGGARPQITASLRSEMVDLKDFLPPEEAGADTAKTEPAETEKTAGKKKVFPADPLPTDALKSVDAVLNYDAKSILAQGLPLNDVKLALTLKDGNLNVKPLSVGIGGGNVTTALSLAGSALNVTVSSDQVELGTLAQQMKASDLLTGAPADLDIALKGNGTSVAALMGGLNGKILVNIGKGKINNSVIDLTGGDLITGVAAKLNPFADKDPYTVLTCAVVRFDVKDGIASNDNGIAIQTGKMNVIGTGKINLKSEELDLGVKTEPRSGVGLSAGGLASLIRLQGTLAEPTVGVDALEAGKAALSVGSAIATGGLSLLAGAVMNRVTASDTPCDTALGIKSKPAAKEDAPAAAETQKEEQPAGGVLEGIGKGIGGLFGK